MTRGRGCKGRAKIDIPWDVSTDEELRVARRGALSSE
jgi:hypothetical protein